MRVRQKKSVSTPERFCYIMFEFLPQERNLEYSILSIDKGLVMMTVNSGRVALSLT